MWCFLIKEIIVLMSNFADELSTQNWSYFLSINRVNVLFFLAKGQINKGKLNIAFWWAHLESSRCKQNENRINKWFTEMKLINVIATRRISWNKVSESRAISMEIIWHSFNYNKLFWLSFVGKVSEKTNKTDVF